MDEFVSFILAYYRDLTLWYQFGVNRDDNMLDGEEDIDVYEKKYYLLSTLYDFAFIDSIEALMIYSLGEGIEMKDEIEVMSSGIYLCETRTDDIHQFLVVIESGTVKVMAYGRGMLQCINVQHRGLNGPHITEVVGKYIELLCCKYWDTGVGEEEYERYLEEVIKPLFKGCDV